MENKAWKPCSDLAEGVNFFYKLKYITIKNTRDWVCSHLAVHTQGRKNAVTALDQVYSVLKTERREIAWNHLHFPRNSRSMSYNLTGDSPWIIMRQQNNSFFLNTYQQRACCKWDLSAPTVSFMDDGTTFHLRLIYGSPQLDAWPLATAAGFHHIHAYSDICSRWTLPASLLGQHTLASRGQEEISGRLLATVIDKITRFWCIARSFLMNQ